MLVTQHVSISCITAVSKSMRSREPRAESPEPKWQLSSNSESSSGVGSTNQPKPAASRSIRSCGPRSDPTARPPSGNLDRHRRQRFEAVVHARCRREPGERGFGQRLQHLVGHHRHSGRRRQSGRVPGGGMALEKLPTNTSCPGDAVDQVTHSQAPSWCRSIWSPTTRRWRWSAHEVLPLVPVHIRHPQLLPSHRGGPSRPPRVVEARAVERDTPVARRVRPATRSSRPYSYTSATCTSSQVTAVDQLVQR